ncbi:hypothetical protein Y032_0340g2975 [Ancylostoma ceylanicum]|uniref:Uncharacterized protein n=1 Tax=Ancylostoma ceylanicum TaxID=53326 RepID=A0A016RYW9_9BILA|nr:hypothetical protein Y032_0340g2975 [Ancylostoma ceylanicum]
MAILFLVSMGSRSSVASVYAYSISGHILSQRDVKRLSSLYVSNSKLIKSSNNFSVYREEVLVNARNRQAWCYPALNDGYSRVFGAGCTCCCIHSVAVSPGSDVSATSYASQKF